MIIKKDNSKIKYLFHYTPKENVEKILSSGVIKSKDIYTFFTNDYYKSINLFEEEMMSNNYYITINKELKRRSYANPNDYRIIKIPYYNDGKFIKMVFDKKDKNSIYYKSTIHKGELYFNKEEVEVLDIPIKKVHTPKFKFLLKLSFLFTMFISPIKAKADTWLDSEEYYDISWWNGTEENTVTINTPEQLAGLLYLNKTYGNTFSNSIIKIEPLGEGCSINKSCDIDMSAHDWVPFNDNFKPSFDGKWIKISGGQGGYMPLCGYHRILLKSINKKIDFIEDNYCKVAVFDTKPPSYRSHVEDCNQLVKYNIFHSIHTTHSTNGDFTVDKFMELKNKIITIQYTPNKGYELDRAVVKRKDGIDVGVTCNQTINTCSFNMPDDEVTVTVNFQKKKYYIDIEDNNRISNVKPNGLITVEYLGEKDFIITPKVDYEFIGYKINNGDFISAQDNHFKISDVEDNMVIELITKPTKYSMKNNISNSKYDFIVDKDFSEIKKIELCSSSINCKNIKTNEYSIINKKISLKKSFINSIDEGEYELQITFANEEQAKTSFRLTHIKENPTINDNPKTKSNIIYILVMGLIIFVFTRFKKEREDF